MVKSRGLANAAAPTAVAAVNAAGVVAAAPTAIAAVVAAAVAAGVVAAVAAGVVAAAGAGVAVVWGGKTEMRRPPWPSTGLDT